MAYGTSAALAFAAGTITLLSAGPATFTVNEAVAIPGVPPVTLGPGTYVLRTVDKSGGTNVIQILSQRQDYVYTTILTIPATRLGPEAEPQMIFSEAPSGTPRELHFWFPAGDTRGYEFVTARPMSLPDQNIPPAHLQMRSHRAEAPTPAEGSPADLYALREALLRIENGKFGAARDCFRRNYFLANNPEGASASFLLALLMIDRGEATKQWDIVNRLDPERARAMSSLGVDGVMESLSSGRSNLKASPVRRFLFNFALDRPDDDLARTAVLSFERHVINGDSFPVEIALNQRREEMEKEKRAQQQWVLSKNQVARLSDCVKSLLNRVGALEYSASVDSKYGWSGSVHVRVVLDSRKLNELDIIMNRSHRTLHERRARLERLISQRDAAVARELDSLRSALRELDRQPGSGTASQFSSLRKWEGAPASAVSRDVMLLSETATSPYVRPSGVFRTNGALAQIDIAASIAKLAEWAGLY